MVGVVDGAAMEVVRVEVVDAAALPGVRCVDRFMCRLVGDNSACGGAGRPGILGIVGGGCWLGSLVVGCGARGGRGGTGGAVGGGLSAMVVLIYDVRS